MSFKDQTGDVEAKVSLLRLFREWFKIALFVVGGGYAIIVVADEVFGRKLKWIGEGELLEHLPVISSIPGLIAGNSAIYVGLKTRGRVGAVVALVGVALPSILIFLCVSASESHIPKTNIMPLFRLQIKQMSLVTSLTATLSASVSISASSVNMMKKYKTFWMPCMNL